MFWGKKKVTVAEIVDMLLEVTKTIYEGLQNTDNKYFSDKDNIVWDKLIVGKLFFSGFIVWHAIQKSKPFKGTNPFTGLNMLRLYQHLYLAYMYPIFNLTEKQVASYGEQYNEQLEKYAKLLESEENNMDEIGMECHKDIYGQQIDPLISLTLVNIMIREMGIVTDMLNNFYKKYEIVD